MANMLNQGLPTLLDQIKRTDPNGAIAQVVESLTQSNPILQHMVFQEGNLPTGHRYTSRTALPSVAWRRLNEGVSPGKSETAQIDETTGMLTGMSAVDVEVAKLNGNEAAFRASEDAAFLQAFNNEIATGLFYHSTKTAPEKFHGLAPRLDSTSGPWGKQIINASGAANRTSVWLVGWGPDSVFGIYPKATTGGLSSIDMGQQLWDDGTGKKFVAYVTQWLWKLGLCVKDYRNVVRIANIDSSTIVKDASSGADLILQMIKAYHQLYNPAAQRLAFYCNRTIGTWLHIQAVNAVKNSTLTIEKVGGVPVTHFLGIPIYEVDAITNSESAVS